VRAHELWDRRDDRGLREREGERRDAENQERARRVLAVVAGRQARSSNGVRAEGSRAAPCGLTLEKLAAPSDVL